ncbi:MAG: 30S ribosomal protein S6 [Chloroflexi bacterium RBG_16_68_14]|nr:MAG: 30S ribosomal protein S6 [Chloroflexi bacterium RBG_16_68_14]
MRRYELVVIISPQVADEAVPETIDRLVRRPIESQGGVCEEVSHWGRRKLAYPIARHLEGNYVLTQLQLEPLQTKELERGLRISEEVIRHLLVRMEE